jgi:hypothetical protein
MKNNVLNLKQENFPYESFIGGWYIPEHICDGMLQFYHDEKMSSHITPGVVGDNNDNNIVKKEVKDSLDLSVYCNETNCYVASYLSYLNACLENYGQLYKYVNQNFYFGLNNNFNIQRYKKGGGFKSWHYERCSPAFSTRILVFMTYLNDVNDGGTEFYYQNIKTQAKKGLTLIWPTDFTHTHRGIISNTKEKYISTGWFTSHVEIVMVNKKNG